MAAEPGYITEKQAVLTRLRRIEGQIRGLQRLVDEEQYCIDILLDQHLEHCLTHATDPAEAQQKLNEASAAIRRLVRS